MNSLPPPPPGRPHKPPIWDRHSFWVGVSWFILIAGLLVYNWGGLWKWEFFGG